MEMGKCTDKSGLVTGASGGLGRAIVLDLAADGANVVALSRSDEGLRETAALAAGLPGSVRVLRADVTDEAGVVVAIAEVESALVALITS
jgi:NAD(P)-dependent dehydrogenase (short-subunit alcohol dehydrogenase family)